jgi:hypothetical protein
MPVGLRGRRAGSSGQAAVVRRAERDGQDQAGVGQRRDPGRRPQPAAAVQWQPKSPRRGPGAASLEPAVSRVWRTRVVLAMCPACPAVGTATVQPSGPVKPPGVRAGGGRAVAGGTPFPRRRIC